ncbi:MAG: arsenate reductase ArsC [Candidatus Cloacimonadaceae bacterium]|nr:arsenate reductase ArsC [Candidatus Cloacimonadaceae bacterium]MDP3114466.1 arsenate reductase ArsC [Candidatus Cloacimonadaceae bacterium]
MQRKVLILCTGNSCRSIIAEAMVNHYLSDRWQAFSAGVAPSKVNPYAAKVLEEMGIDTASMRSKSVVEFLQRDDLDLVITVCDHAKETCPVFLKPVKQFHIGIDDPAPSNAKPGDISLLSFRKTVEDVREKILGYLIGIDRNLK